MRVCRLERHEYVEDGGGNLRFFPTHLDREGIGKVEQISRCLIKTFPVQVEFVQETSFDIFTKFGLRNLFHVQDRDAALDDPVIVDLILDQTNLIDHRRDDGIEIPAESFLNFVRLDEYDRSQVRRLLVRRPRHVLDATFRMADPVERRECRLFIEGVPERIP